MEEIIDRIEENTLTNYVYLQIREEFEKIDSGETEIQHTLEVYWFTELLSKSYELSLDDINCVLIAALLHDIGRVCVFPPRGHTEISREQLEKYLPIEILANDSMMEKVYKCVVRHSTSSGEKPETIMEKIVFDADNLTVLTEFGVKRWFFKAESWGKSKSVQEAERPLRAIVSLVNDNKFFYLPESIGLAKDSFYFRNFGEN